MLCQTSGNTITNTTASPIYQTSNSAGMGAPSSTLAITTGTNTATIRMTYTAPGTTSTSVTYTILNTSSSPGTVTWTYPTN